MAPARTAQVALRIAALALIVIWAGFIRSAEAAETEGVWVNATGHAFVSGAADKDTARTRALGDALISAALAGGSTLRGHSAMRMGRITADLMILRPAGKILKYEMQGARLHKGLWTVNVRALVGPIPKSACAGRRQLVLTAYEPKITVRPEAPAWTAPLANDVALTIFDVLDDHSSTTIDRIAPAQVRQTSATGSDMDYMSLTRGTHAGKQPGDHGLRTEIKVDVIRGATSRLIQMTTELHFSEPNGFLGRKQLVRTARYPQGGAIEAITGRTRSALEHELTKNIRADLTSLLDQLSCVPPSARIESDGKTLSVPIGSRHGLSRASLAFVDDPNDSFGLLEISSLKSGRAILRPIDPTRKASDFEGRQVYFVEAGL